MNTSGRPSSISHSCAMFVLHRRARLATLCAPMLLVCTGQALAADPTTPSRLAVPSVSQIHEQELALNQPNKSEAVAAAQNRPTAAVESRSALNDALRADDSAKQVHVSIASYAWLTSQAGNVTQRGITTDADISFTDLVHESDSLFALMGAVDLEYKRFVFQISAEYARVEFKGSKGVFRNGTVNSDMSETLGWYGFFGGYRLLDQTLTQKDSAASKPRMTLDAFIGGRITNISVNTKLSASSDITLPSGEILNVGTTKEWGTSHEWFEPFVGARFGLDLSERWSLSFRGDLGGFNIAGSQCAWSTSALVGYRWEMDGWALTAFGGYRILGQDYSSGDFAWDVITYGPVLGVQFSFSF